MNTKLNSFKVIENGCCFPNDEEKEKRKKQVAHDLYKILSKLEQPKLFKEEVNISSN